jgi:demethylmenaquinone methyltransferase/2-methoxy-6-polyprenyl-1,4-benzoquinol methylase
MTYICKHSFIEIKIQEENIREEIRIMVNEENTVAVENISKGNVFNGWLSGSNYDRCSKLMGVRDKLMYRAAMAIPLRTGQRVLDIGCGTVALGKAAAERIGPQGSVTGVDLAEKQLEHARRVTANLSVPFEFYKTSADSLPFNNASFDVVVSSMAMHEMSPNIRSEVLKEVSRVLKPQGIFGLVDWSRPKFGIASLVWLPFILSRRNSDNWQNRYPVLCKKYGLILDSDVYLNSLIRCQTFHKVQEN